MRRGGKGRSGEDESEGEIKERSNTWRVSPRQVVTTRLRAASLSHFMGPVVVVDTNMLHHKRGAVG